MSRTGMSLMAAGAAGLLVLGATATASAAASAATAPSAAGHRWRIMKSVKTDFTGNFTAVAATGKTTGWAFDGDGSTRVPLAYRLRGTTWRRASFPGRKNEEVITAAATSPADVWAFTQGRPGHRSRVLRYNGHHWTVVKKFSRQIGGASVVAANDVWVFGTAGYAGHPALGAWHYNGHRWRRVGRNIQGGSALSARNAWGYRGVRVEHWNGRRWVGKSVKSLLPAADPNGLSHPQVAGVLALSAHNVYALGNGNAQDAGGPLVVLHYNGRRWSRVAKGGFGYGPSPEFSSDGHGGLWLPMLGSLGGSAYLVHYRPGKLIQAKLPIAASRITITAVSRIPGTRRELAGGSRHARNKPGYNVAAVLLKYS